MLLFPMFFVVLLSILFSEPAQAVRKCRPTWNADGSFFGVGCDSMGIRNSAGRTVAALGEIMRVNPAVLPTVPTPLGAELNVHNRGFGPQESQSEVSMVKGLPWVGLGAGTWNTGSMVGADLPALFEGSAYEGVFRQYQGTQASRSGYRFGLSLRIPFLPNPERLRLRAGLSIGSGKVPGETSNTIGAVLDAGPFYLSVSNVNDKLGAVATTVSVETVKYALGVDAGTFHAGVSHSVVQASRKSRESALTLRHTGDLWSLFAAVKMYETFRGQRRTWPSATIHRNYGDHFTAGYIYGLYRGSHSLSLQVFL